MCMCAFWRGLNIAFFALPNPLSCSVMNKICLNQEKVNDGGRGVIEGESKAGKLGRGK